MRLVESESSFEVGTAGTVSCLTLVPQDCRFMLVLGHGAGAGMRHTGMQTLAQALAAESIGTLRYQFPYMERGRRFPDSLAVRLATVDAAIALARQRHAKLALFAGGRSMGGRMTSTWLADHRDSRLLGLVFFAFPLHPAARPGIERAQHLAKIEVPMLFVQGTRDKLAQPSLLGPVIESLQPRASLVTIEDADHSFNVPKRLARGAAEVYTQIALATRGFLETVGA